MKNKFLYKISFINAKATAGVEDMYMAADTMIDALNDFNILCEASNLNEITVTKIELIKSVYYNEQTI